MERANFNLKTDLKTSRKNLRSAHDITSLMNQKVMVTVSTSSGPNIKSLNSTVTFKK